LSNSTLGDIVRLVDLDDLTGLERAWGELERLHALRAIDPELRANIERHLDQLDPADAAPIRAALDEIHPEAVLEVHFKTIVPNRPVIGALAPRRPT
jgi:hypothetical protein